MTRSAEEFPECACRYAETKIEPDKKPTVIPRSKYRKENREKDVNVKFIYKSKLLSTVTQKSINSIDKNITNLVLKSRSEQKKTISKMKLIVLVVFCAIAYVSAQAELEPEDYIPSRFRRQERGSIVIQGTKEGRNRPSLDIDYKQRVYDKNGMTGNAYGGVNIRPGQPTRQHAGFEFGKEYKNGFIRGQSEVQRGPGGRLSPYVGINGGFRF